MTSRQRQYVLTVTVAVAGTVLFAYAIRRAGLGLILNSISNVGWGLLPILALAGLRFFLRASAWRLCIPPDSRIGRRRALASFIAGDAIGNLTPLGLVASEPTKVFLTRHHLATRESVASLALDNLIYTGSVVVFVAIGIVMLLATAELPWALREWAIGSLGVLAVFTIGGVKWLRSPTGPPSGGAGWLQAVRKTRDLLAASSAGSPARLWGAFGLGLCFHAAAVAEGFITLRWLLDYTPTLEQAVLFEALNRVTTAVFKFVPFRVGVDEALSGAFAPMIAINPVTGVSLAVIRKVRSLFWTAVGLTIIAVHHAREGRATGRLET